ncbi:MAG: hypothetical protein QOH57_4789, partial [Mycobacterium sp.]|nr:hypothetical protein [Mycobacterium sp.]
MSDYDPDFDAILRTDRFVDALAGGARMSPVDPLSAMLGGWRDGVRSQPDSHVVTFEQAASALYATAKPLRRSRIGLAVVGGAAAAVLALGGFGAVVYDAQPGDALYGLRSSLFGDVKAVRDDQVTLAAQTELAQVQQLVQQGKWDEAQQKLVKLGPAVKSVDNPQNQQQLVNQYNALAVKVIEKNPEATVPPAGQSAPVQPSSPLTLLPPPSVAADTPTTPTPPDTNMLLSPSPTGPLPTPTGPLPTPTGPPPTPTGPLPTATGPLPTATGPLPTGPLPTATAA